MKKFSFLLVLFCFLVFSISSFAEGVNDEKDVSSNNELPDIVSDQKIDPEVVPVSSDIDDLKDVYEKIDDLIDQGNYDKEDIKDLIERLDLIIDVDDDENHFISAKDQAIYDLLKAFYDDFCYVYGIEHNEDNEISSFEKIDVSSNDEELKDLLKDNNEKLSQLVALRLLEVNNNRVFPDNNYQYFLLINDDTFDYIELLSSYQDFDFSSSYLLFTFSNLPSDFSNVGFYSSSGEYFYSLKFSSVFSSSINCYLTNDFVNYSLVFSDSISNKSNYSSKLKLITGLTYNQARDEVNDTSVIAYNFGSEPLNADFFNSSGGGDDPIIPDPDISGNDVSGNDISGSDIIYDDFDEFLDSKIIGNRYEYEVLHTLKQIEIIGVILICFAMVSLFYRKRV